MVKKIVSMVLAFCLLCFSVTPAFSETQYGVYLEPKVTYSFYTGDYIESDHFSGAVRSGTSSFGGGLALGYDFYEKMDLPLRVELEYLMRSDARFDVSKETMKIQTPKTLFANAYLDYQNDTNLTPYVTAGAGMSFVEDRTNFAWNFGTGVRFDVTENVDLDFGVRYMDYGKYNPGDYSTRLSSIDCSLGAMYTF